MKNWPLLLLLLQCGHCQDRPPLPLPLPLLLPSPFPSSSSLLGNKKVSDLPKLPPIQKDPIDTMDFLFNVAN